MTEKKGERYSKGWSSMTGVQKVGKAQSPKSNPYGLFLNSTIGSSKPKITGPEGWVYVGSRQISFGPFMWPKSPISFLVNGSGFLGLVISELSNLQRGISFFSPGF